MERCVEDGNLGKPAPKDFACRLDALDVSGIVKRRKLDAVLDCAKHSIVDLYGVFEVLATVDNAMANCMNISNALNLGWSLVRTSPTKYQFNSGTSISQRGGR